MDIQETGLAYVLRRDEIKQLLHELGALFSAHDDWNGTLGCPVDLPVTRRIRDDLERRLGLPPVPLHFEPDGNGSNGFRELPTRFPGGSVERILG